MTEKMSIETLVVYEATKDARNGYDACAIIDAALEAARQQGFDDLFAALSDPKVCPAPHEQIQGSTVASPLQGPGLCDMGGLTYEHAWSAIPEGKVLVDRELVANAAAALDRLDYQGLSKRLRAALAEQETPEPPRTPHVAGYGTNPTGRPGGWEADK